VAHPTASQPYGDFPARDPPRGAKSRRKKLPFLSKEFAFSAPLELTPLLDAGLPPIVLANALGPRAW
jgi:hypothetical protein